MASAERGAKPAESPAIDRIPMNERRRYLMKIVMMMRVDMRELFGMEVANRWGFWVDRHLSRKIRDFAYWLDYPKGDRKLQGHEGAVCAAVMSDDGYFLYTADHGAVIKVWRMLENQMIREWEAHESTVHSLAFKSGLLISGSWDTSIKIWDTHRDYRLVHTLEGHSKLVNSLDINEKATQVVSGSSDNSIRIWSVKTGECIRVLMGHSKRVSSVQFIGDLILSGSYDRSIKVWNSSDGTQIQSVEEGIDGWMSDLSVNCDASLATSVFLGSFSLHTWPELKYIRSVGINALRCAFHPIHPHILAVSERCDVSIHIFDLSNDDVICTLEGNFIDDLCFTPDGTRLVSVCDDKSVRIWDISDL